MRALRVMTYNVQYSAHRFAPTLDAIEDIDADVVLLQEASPAVDAGGR